MLFDIKNFIKNNTILHNLASMVSNFIPTFIIHNFEKYKAIRFTIENAYMDSINGDYLEFGSLTGSSLNHAINCYKKIYKKDYVKMFAFDSFKGFPESNHKIFKSENYIGSYEKVKKIGSKHPNCRIIKGFFSETLKDDFLKKEIKKISITFIDCDLAVSSKDIFEFIKPRLSFGSYLIIDDYYNIDFNKNSISKEFNKYFSKSEFQITGFFGLHGVIIRFFGNIE